jgi:hypothetical protein
LIAQAIASWASKPAAPIKDLARNGGEFKGATQLEHASTLGIGSRATCKGGDTMKVKILALAAALTLSSTVALAQGNTAGGSSQAGGSAASKTTTGDSMNGGTTAGGGAAMKNGATGPAAQSSMPSSKDASTQGASTAGAAEKKGDATSPGGMMKKWKEWTRAPLRGQTFPVA